MKTRKRPDWRVTKVRFPVFPFLIIFSTFLAFSIEFDFMSDCVDEEGTEVLDDESEDEAEASKLVLNAQLLLNSIDTRVEVSESAEQMLDRLEVIESKIQSHLEGRSLTPMSPYRLFNLVQRVCSVS